NPSGTQTRTRKKNSLLRGRATRVASDRWPAFAVVAASPPPSLLVKGADPMRVLRMAVPLVPSAPLARVALLGGYGSFGAVMGQFIPPIRELPPTARLADQQEVDEKGDQGWGPGIRRRTSCRGVLRFGLWERPLRSQAVRVARAPP